MTTDEGRTALIIGASRGLGLGLAQEYVARDWTVTASVRDAAGAARLQASASSRLEIVTVDIAVPDQVAALRAELANRQFDLLFIVAGLGGDRMLPLSEIPVADFVGLQTANCYWPVYFVEKFIDLVAPSGTVVLMSSILASLALNDFGTIEPYRISKAALNMAVKSASARWGDRQRSILLMHPGWVRTDMGTDEAPLDVATSVTGMADTIAARGVTPGLAFVDYQNEVLPW